MQRIWTPSQWGVVMTRSRRWRVILDDINLWVNQFGMWTAIPLGDLFVEVECGQVWADVHILRHASLVAQLKGMRNAKALELCDACANEAEKIRGREADFVRIQRFKETLPAIVAWSLRTATEMVDNLRQKRLISEEHICAWVSAKPAVDVSIKDPVIQTYLARRPDTEQKAVSFWHADIRKVVSEQNDKLARSGIPECR